MSIIADLKATFNNIFQIGKNGVKLKNNLGTLEIRNSADDYSDVRCNVINASNLQSYLASIAQGRLTLTSNTPVLSSNVTGATTIFYTPYTGNQISIWNGTQWEVRTFSELSLSLSGLTADTNYDVFIFDNSGTLTLESIAWSDSGAGTSARATALSWLNGVKVKSTDNRKYLGSFRTTATTGQTEFSFTNTSTPCNLFLFNEYNREKIAAILQDTTSHTYQTDTLRNYRNLSGNRINLIAFNPINISFLGNTAGSGITGFGLNSSSVALAETGVLQNGGRNSIPFFATVPIGFNYIQVLQRGTSGSSFTSMYLGVDYEC
jgi:hypothetical protein